MNKSNFNFALLRIALISIGLHIFAGSALAQKKFLFDATKAETAGNADWVIDEDGNVPGRFPTPAESTITQSTPETYWTGALSSWGIALVKMGHRVETLPAGTAISYGNAANPQDLKDYDVYIVDEPNVAFTASEKTAIMQFVQNGGGLFMISDHAGADRNNDGWDAVRIWNDLMRNNSVQSLPFGMLVDSTDYSETTANILADTSNPILHGPAGPVSQLKYSDGATITLNPSANSTVRGLIWRTSSTQGLTNVMFATASFGAGKVCLIGDSSPADDGTGASGNSLYNGWTGDVGVSHANMHLNASLWLIKKDTALSPQLLLSAQSLNFGDVGMNDSSDVTLKITNGLLNPQTLDSIYTGTTAFKSLSTKATVAADTLKIVVRFFPKNVGMFGDTLFLRNASDTTLVKVPLSGNSPYSSIDITPQALNFGAALKDSVKQIVFTITNNSVTTLEVDSLSTRTKYFQVFGSLANRIIRKGDTVAMSIRFQPDSIRQYVDTLYVVNNSQLPIAKFPISGLGALTGVTQPYAEIPKTFELSQNFPNPFNPSTLIRYSVPLPSRVKLEIFNVAGQRVVTLVDDERNVGIYEAEWKGVVTSGVYFYRFEAVAISDPHKQFLETKKMMLLK